MALVTLHNPCCCLEPSIRRSQIRRDASRLRPFKILCFSSQHSNENDLSAQEFFQSFLRSRRARSDVVSRASDLLWKREVEEMDDARLGVVQEKLSQIQKIHEEDENSSFFKLSQARSWSLGVDDAPTNTGRREVEKGRAREDRKRQSMLEYEAVSSEL
eukprot:TRINITY_DN14801_c0_g1_i1.p1 TRINITY_DN14801_c0_g1~~TRINITY_DN14801_c0_g1_i1.p1  ORF type:complete len:159 (+),score=17.81 TRINITY_DN14801_c0_g1_i1:704-1180(+)